MTQTGTPKRALVTGGNKGIGFAICKGLLAANFELILAARSLEKGKDAAEQLQSPHVRVVQLDVTDDDSIESVVEEVRSHGSLDVLINNAGIYPDGGVNILTLSRDLMTHAMNVNTFGAIRVAQAFLPLLEQANGAKIINVSSGLGQLKGLSAEIPSYCLSKLALNGATIMLADALRTRNIAVYSMSPGWVRTDMGGANAARSPEEGADTAIWLATEASPSDSGKFFKNRSESSY